MRRIFSLTVRKDSLTPFNKSKGSSRPNKDKKILGSVYIPNVKGVTEKFKRAGNLKTILKTEHTPMSALRNSRLEGDPKEEAQCIYSNPC
jgi:hypothetical protein